MDLRSHRGSLCFLQSVFHCVIYQTFEYEIWRIPRSWSGTVVYRMSWRWQLFGCARCWWTYPNHQLVVKHLEYRLDATQMEMLLYKEMTVHRKNLAGRNMQVRKRVTTDKWDGDNWFCERTTSNTKWHPPPTFFTVIRGKQFLNAGCFLPLPYAP